MAGKMVLLNAGAAPGHFGIPQLQCIRRVDSVFPCRDAALIHNMPLAVEEAVIERTGIPDMGQRRADVERIGDLLRIPGGNRPCD
jgi:hypothetical protein